MLFIALNKNSPVAPSNSWQTFARALCTKEVRLPKAKPNWGKKQLFSWGLLSKKKTTLLFYMSSCQNCLTNGPTKRMVLVQTPKACRSRLV